MTAAPYGADPHCYRDKTLGAETACVRVHPGMLRRRIIRVKSHTLSHTNDGADIPPGLRCNHQGFNPNGRVVCLCSRHWRNLRATNLRDAPRHRPDGDIHCRSPQIMPDGMPRLNVSIYQLP
jgi:hypothetical protein